MSDSLPAAVSVEGAREMRSVRLQRIQTRLRGLLGADQALALAGTTVLGHFILGLSWPLGFLLAALVVASRPAFPAVGSP
jgi:NhaP-type Na+/H+ or K+/H+ antiporter